MTLPGQPKTIKSSGNRREPRLLRKLGYSIAALAAIVLLVPAARFIYHTKTETFSLTYFPGNTYAPVRDLPGVDEHGEPRVVLVRRKGQMECFDVFYSQKLNDLLEANPSRRVNITYRVFYRFGRPFWIETLDVAGLGIEPDISRFSVQGSHRTGNTKPGECF